MPDVRIVLQARLNSSRLPGKMLLPVGGFLWLSCVPKEP